MTYIELKASHKDKVLTGRHRKSFTLLCAHVGCAEGKELDTAYQTAPTVTDLHSIFKKYGHVQTTGLIARHNLEHEEEDNNRSVFDPTRDRSGKFRLPKRKRYRKLKPRPNPDIHPPPSASSVHGLRVWKYRESLL
jgi:hypothetical protein